MRMRRFGALLLVLRGCGRRDNIELLAGMGWLLYLGSQTGYLAQVFGSGIWLVGRYLVRKDCD